MIKSIKLLVKQLNQNMIFILQENIRLQEYIYWVIRIYWAINKRLKKIQVKIQRQQILDQNKMQKINIQQKQPSTLSYNLDQFDQWYKELIRKGYVVIKNILSQDQVIQAQNYFWEWLECLQSGIKRNDPNTWKNQNWPGVNDMGFFVTYGGCHTKTSWMIRTHPKVQQVFAKIWKTNQLITSLDTIISWRPWWNQKSKNSWRPYVQNLHLDQNPSFKKGLQCVQGMVPLKRVRKDQIGGLMVVPYSNSQQNLSSIINRYPEVSYYSSDWLQLKNSDPLIGKGQLIQCNAGDLVLWDSRTVHGGKICQPNQQFKSNNINQLVRIAVTVAMVPRNLCSQSNLKLRKQYFQKKIGTTHWPQQALKNSMGKMAPGIDRNKITYKFPQLNDQILKVL